MKSCSCILWDFFAHTAAGVYEILIQNRIHDVLVICYFNYKSQAYKLLKYIQDVNWHYISSST